VIKVRFQSIENNEDDLRFKITDGELLSKAFARALKGINTGELPKDEVFKAVLNGVEVDKDLLETIKLKKEDNVLICPVIKKGDSGALIRQVALIVVTVAVGLSTQHWGPLASALTTAGAAMATGLILNGLIPPPSIPASGSEISSEVSQMYSVTGQSNASKKLSTVPKVYGKHRLFPPVAANPYTQLENDSTGELVQYLYAIYDFGLGPGVVEDLRIGDTSIEEFTDIDYRFVDPNKPAISEGIWDEDLAEDFELYKNDVESENVSYALNGNSDVSGTPVAEYQTVRNSASNTEGNKQTIILNFANQEGLVGFNSSGTKIERSIDIKIQFRKVGQTTWRMYNDPAYVSNHVTIGGKVSEYGGTQLEFFPLPPYTRGFGNPLLSYDATPYTLLHSSQYNYARVDLTDNPEYLTDPDFTQVRELSVYYGIPKGATTLRIKNNSQLKVGNHIYIYGKLIGIITGVSTFGVEYKTVTLDRPTPAIFLFKTKYNQSSDGQLQNNFYFSPQNTYAGRSYVNSSSTGFVRITGNSTRPVYSTVSFTPRDTGQFEVRVQRVQTIGAYGPEKRDRLTWASIVTRIETIPIVTEKRHLFMEIRIKATNQLSGSISNLSGVVTTALEVYDDDTLTWSRQITSNPAWVFTDLLIGEVNKKAIPKSRLDLDSIVEWADYCDASPPSPTGVTLQFPRYESNFVLDYKTTLQEVLNQVSNSAQATLNMVDGKYAALLDIDRVTPVQIFTPRNSKDFSVTRNYSKQPHAIRVRYIDPSLNWELSDKLVYDDGFNDTNATDIDKIETFACTNQEQAWRFGRFMMAQNKYRQEVMSLTVDFEHLICTRGDFVQITQDVMRVGGRPARVKAVVGTTVTIDDSLDLPGGPSYGYVFRDSNDGVIYESTLTPSTPSSFVADGAIPQVGDLIVVGEVDSIVFDCIVKSITPNDDLSAQLVLVERAEQVYNFESDEEFVPYNPQISLITDPNSFPPAAVEDLIIVDSGWACAGTGYEYYVDLDWGYPEGSVFEFFEIYADYGLGYAVAGRSSDSDFRYVAPDEEFLGNTFSFKVLAVSASGKKIPLGGASIVSVILNLKTDPPSDVEIFGTDITAEVLQLSWDRISDCDANEYLIRYSPNVNSIWGSSIPLMRVDSNTSTVSTQARSGVYLIKAIDFNGNQSLNEARAVTTIPELFNLNIIETITDSPTFPGSKQDVVDIGAALVLKEKVSGDPENIEYFTPGYYNYDNLLDLGDIYTVRLQSLIEAEGFYEGDLMVNWTTLAGLTAMSSVSVDDWEVQTQYRSTDTFNTISLWTTLDAVSSLSGGQDDLWTEWRNFTMGDATGRIFQHRLKLISNRPNASPRVFDATIKADMPDRVDNYNNLVSDASTGYTVTYSPAFKGPGTSPNIQVSLENAQSGDYWTFTNRDLEGFTVKFFNSSDTGVVRTFDTMVKGYGRKSNLVI
jgi:hypothetical protein